MIEKEYIPVMHAAHQLVARHGATDFARVLKKTPNSILNMVNINLTGPKLGLLDALRMMRHSGRYELLQRLCAACGFVAVPVTPAMTLNGCVVQALTQWQASIGNTAQTIHDALEDHIITPNERQCIEQAGLHKISAWWSLMDNLRSLEKPDAKRHV